MVERSGRKSREERERRRRKKRTDERARGVSGRGKVGGSGRKGRKKRVWRVCWAGESTHERATERKSERTGGLVWSWGGWEARWKGRGRWRLLPRQLHLGAGGPARWPGSRVVREASQVATVQSIVGTVRWPAQHTTGGAPHSRATQSRIATVHHSLSPRPPARTGGRGRGRHQHLAVPDFTAGYVANSEHAAWTLIQCSRCLVCEE